ncbi:hypothetical protein P7C73_g2488, partial [Tremellales sp. Uapishka_1]
MLSLETINHTTLSSNEEGTRGRDARDVVMLLGSSGPWENEYIATAGHIDDVAHSLLDLYITILSIPPSDPSLHISSPSPVSPKENPASTASHSTTAPSQNTAFHLAGFWTAQSLTELKIHLRDKRPDKKMVVPSWVGAEEAIDGKEDETVEGMGKNDGTVRFIWGLGEGVNL